MDIVEEMRGFEVDHEPDGWPAVKMKQASALCDEIDALRAELQQLREQEPVIQIENGIVVNFNPNYDGDVSNGEFYAAPVTAIPIPKQDPSVADVVEAVAEFVETQQGSPFDSSVMACAIRGQLKYGELFKNITPSPRITEQDAREIAMSAWRYWMNGCGRTIDTWLEEEWPNVLNKINGDENGK